MGYLCVYYIHAGEDGFGYPAFGAAKAISYEWMWPLLVRNIIGTWLIAGGWDWFLHFSPLADSMKPFKINATPPLISQLKHDAFWTTIASVWGTVIEVLVCIMYANSGDFYPKLLIERPYLHTVLALLITHWRVPHFYAMHRFLHPWRLKNFPDIGRFMYKHIHSLHHKSYNPTTLSGTSFHPVESMMYYSACFLVAPFSVHITIPVGCIIDCGIGAWLGHDGFMAPGVGHQFHQHHH